MTLQPTDRDLVAALRGGNRAALGQIYDRYADALYDTAAAMLRDRDEAADVVQEVFLVAAQKLDQLRDPDRLKAWLFAVLRHEVYRRTTRRSRTRPTDFSVLPAAGPGAAEMVAPTDPLAEGADVERQELAELVRAAAAGLDERDQLVMEMTLRQDLSGDDLAAAAGVTTKQAHVLVHRMRDRLTKSIGAVTVARMGRDDCDELAGILAGWDGSFSVLIRKRVARHVERCEVCDETRAKYPVGALFAAAPALAAPPDLRDAVLTAASRSAAPAHDHRFDRNGFPRPPRSAQAPGLPRSSAGLVAAALLLVALVIGVMVDGDDDPATDVAAGAPVDDEDPAGSSSTGAAASGSSSTGTSATSDPAATTIEPGSTGPAPVPGTETTPGIPPAAAPPTPGSVVVSTPVIDLGDTAPSGSLALSNPGDEPVAWDLSRTSSSPFVWDAVAGSIDPGGVVTVRVSVDRAPLAEGSYSGDFTISGGGTTSPVEVRARVERAPVITNVRGPSNITCPPSTSEVVFATVTDESAVDSVVLRWSGPGTAGQVPMTLGRAGWQGTLDVDSVDGSWTFTVVATDVRGNAASVSRPFVVSGCGGGGGFATP